MVVDRRPRTRRSVPRGLLVATLLLLATLPGCALRTPAVSGRVAVGEEQAALDWPERHPEPLHHWLDARRIAAWPGLGRPPADGSPRDPDALRRRLDRSACLHRLTLRGGDYFSRGPWGAGLVLQGEERTDAGDTRYCVLMNRLETPDLERVLAGPSPRRVGSEGIDRFHFVLREAPATAPSRGLVVHLVSLGDQRYERAVLDRLRADGWDVLTCVPRGFTISLLADAAEDATERRLAEPAALAATLDEYAGSSALAVESLVGYLDHRAGRRRPVVVAGFSLGALAAPTVAARLGSRVEAAMLVGGGANVAQILMGGALTGDVTRFVRRIVGPEAAPGLAALPAAYLEASRLDPYHAAPALAGTPVLMLHGAFDAIVPAANGDLLYERLGRPDRWIYPLGHLGLFWVLPTQADAIASWVRDVVERPELAALPSGA